MIDLISILGMSLPQSTTTSQFLEFQKMDSMNLSDSVIVLDFETLQVVQLNFLIK